MQSQKEHRSIAWQAMVELAKALDQYMTNKERRTHVLINLKDWQKSRDIPRNIDPVQLIRKNRER